MGIGGAEFSVSTFTPGALAALEHVTCAPTKLRKRLGTMLSRRGEAIALSAVPPAPVARLALGNRGG
jgi:hypothetical protein